MSRVATIADAVTSDGKKSPRKSSRKRGHDDSVAHDTVSVLPYSRQQLDSMELPQLHITAGQLGIQWSDFEEPQELREAIFREQPNMGSRPPFVLQWSRDLLSLFTEEQLKNILNGTSWNDLEAEAPEDIIEALLEWKECVVPHNAIQESVSHF